MASKHKSGKNKWFQPKPLSSLIAKDTFIIHNVLSPEMNSIDSVLASDDGEVYMLTDVSKEMKEFIYVDKFLMVCGLKSGHVKHMLATTLVHPVDTEFMYSMPKK